MGTTSGKHGDLRWTVEGGKVSRPVDVVRAFGAQEKHVLTAHPALRW